MDYVFKIYLHRPKRVIYRPIPRPIPKPITRRKAKRIIYNPRPSKNTEDYECGFSFPVRLVYSNKINEDELEF